MNYSSSCLVFLLLCAVCIWNISAHPRDQLGGSVGVTEVNDILKIKDEDVHGVISSPSTSAMVEGKRIGGRKMARLEKDVKAVVDGAMSSKTVTSSSKLGGKSSCGSHEEGNGECKNASSFDSEKGVVDEYEHAGFVAFSQDYHSPRHHPPKNN